VGILPTNQIKLIHLSHAALLCPICLPIFVRKIERLAKTVRFNRGVVLSPAVIPIALTVTWRKLTSAGILAGALIGASLGVFNDSFLFLSNS
jgi:uncharacterized membrane protein YadS